MRINRRRLEESMEALGRIGATAKGGLNRVALTDDDRRGRDLLVKLGDGSLPTAAGASKQHRLLWTQFDGHG